jgi:hypothetical protein
MLAHDEEATASERESEIMIGMANVSRSSSRVGLAASDLWRRYDVELERQSGSAICLFVVVDCVRGIAKDS